MVTKLSVVLWLIAAAMLLALLPLLMVASNLRSEAARLNATLAPIRQSLAGLPTPLPDVQPLRESLARIQAQATQVQAIQATLTAPRVDWPAAMTAIADYDPNQVALVSIAQSGAQATIGGRAVSGEAVAGYLRALEDSGQFSRVALQSSRVNASGPGTLAVEFVVSADLTVAAP